MVSKTSKLKTPIKTCPICGLNKSGLFYAMKGYVLSKCKVCEMVWDPFPPRNLIEQYDKSYFSNENPKGGYANYFEGMAINKKTFKERLINIYQVTGFRDRLLDVGSALGDCLLEAKKLGWKKIEGLELSNYACAFAKKRGLKVKKGSLEETNYSRNTFNIVTMQDVIEHVQDPTKDVKKIYNLLKPGGWVFLVTPNINSTWSKILKSRWYHYKPGEHILYFSPKTIELILRNSGFTNISIRGASHIMSLNYILNRMRYYSPIFAKLLDLVKKTPLGALTFKLHTGELEAWGQKQ